MVHTRKPPALWVFRHTYTYSPKSWTRTKGGVLWRGIKGHNKCAWSHVGQQEIPWTCCCQKYYIVHQARICACRKCPCPVGIVGRVSIANQKSVWPVMRKCCSLSFKIKWTSLGWYMPLWLKEHWQGSIWNLYWIHFTKINHIIWTSTVTCTGFDFP